ncbi:hypothetical protein A2U01_0066767, partial [Trifolium medium]|nr:hypothetical protein [Trifolium medium]
EMGENGTADKKDLSAQ